MPLQTEANGFDAVELREARAYDEVDRPLKPVLPIRKRHGVLWWVGIVTAIILLLGIGLHHSSSASSVPTGPSSCINPGVDPDANVRALRDCPQFAAYRAQVTAQDAYYQSRGITPPPPVWAGLGGK